MHFFPTIIATARSPYSGRIKVVDGFGFRHLSTNSIQQSGGLVSEIWRAALRPYAQKHSSWLVLGVAGGSVLHLISRKYAPAQITAIDIDPVIVDFGKKYFNLLKIKTLNLKITDAHNYCLTTDDRFDYLLVDLFGNSSCPSFVYTPKYLKRLPQIANHVFINHLSQNSRKLESALTASRLTFSSRRILKNIVYHVAIHP